MEQPRIEGKVLTMHQLVLIALTLKGCFLILSKLPLWVVAPVHTPLPIFMHIKGACNAFFMHFCNHTSEARHVMISVSNIFFPCESDPVRH